MTPTAPTEQIAHLALQFGRLMLQNGADTDHVAADLQRFAASFGAEANLLVTYDALLVTIAHDNEFRTKLGHRVPGMNVGMGALYALQSTLLHAQQGAPPDRLQAELDGIERAPPAYPHWLIIAGLALTAASLSRLFGGDWGAFAITAVAGAAETWFRLKLLSFRLNTVLVIFATALARRQYRRRPVPPSASPPPPPSASSCPA